MSMRNRAVPAAARYNQRGRMGVNPTVHAIRTNRALTAASTSGYRMEIRDRQPEHLPRRASQDRTGRFSRAVIWCPHFGQADRGRTTDRPCGRRQTTTFTKDPTSAPKMPMNTYSMGVSAVSSLGVTWRLSAQWPGTRPGHPGRLSGEVHWPGSVTVPGGVWVVVVVTVV